VCILFGTSILGNIVHPWWFICGLVDIPVQSRTMMDVIEAVQNNVKKLLLTFALAMLVLYVFSSVVFYSDMFRGSYGFEDTEVACETLWDCWYIHMTYGLLYSPIWLNDDVEHHSIPTQGGLFVLVYSIIVNLTLSAIVAGIIIDSFSELRSKSDKIREDMQERCFICGIDRENFETLGLSFPNHIKYDHNMWQYLWFRIHLDNKDSTAYTGQEQFVHNLIQAKPMITSFFPIKKAMVIEGRGTEKKDMLSLFAKVEAMGQQHYSVMKSMVAQDEKLDKLTALVERCLPQIPVPQSMSAVAEVNPAAARVPEPTPVGASIQGTGTGTGTVAFAEPPAASSPKRRSLLERKTGSAY
jgi:hypothetical protein